MIQRFLLVTLLATTAPIAMAADVSLDTQFPGGNVIVKGIEGGTVRLAPDLRGGQSWFYWCFDAQAAKPGKVTFAFEGSFRIGVRGPAYSRDGGKDWQWLGMDTVVLTKGQESFTYTFAKAGERVRFAVAIPYLQADLDAFLTKNAKNPHLSRSELCKTRKGTPVDLLQIGQPGPGVQAMLVTARHHACESMASYVLEGFLQEAMSDSPAAVAFRKRYVVYAVPLVDKDGVQAGDQGKNRSPHDHNRDYGAEPLYPEVRAIQELADARDIRYSVDFHCPALRGDIHEAFHFLGLGVPHVRDNLNEWIEWIREERPPAVMAPLNQLVDASKPKAVNRSINSHYMATRDKALLAATLEVPYTQVRAALDQHKARAYGAGLLRAWVRTTFVPAGQERGEASFAKLKEFRTEFLKLSRSKPPQAEMLANTFLKLDAPALYRNEAGVQLASLRLRQKQFPTARTLIDTVLKDGNATNQQRATATLLRLQAACLDPQTTAKDVEARLGESLQFPIAAPEHLAKSYELAADYYRKNKDYSRALETTRKQIPVAAAYEVGKLWNLIAVDHEQLKQSAEALQARKEAAAYLRPRLTPVPVSVFGAAMANDYFEALRGIPGTTAADLRAAGQMVLDHKVASAASKDRVRKALAELDPK